MSLDSVQALVKALEAGSYNAAPATLVQGAALQVEDLSNILHNTTFQEKSIKLQKLVGVESCKSLLAQFDRQLSYGSFGGAAVAEGGVGIENTSDFVRDVVPMAFYAEWRRVTDVADIVATVDGKKASERSAEDAAKKLAGVVEFDCFRGAADFSNAGVFDGALSALPEGMLGMRGLDLQVRKSDNQRNTQDLMFNEFGNSASVVLQGGGALTQDLVEDAHVRSSMNHGEADLLLVDPIALSNYNKLVIGKERIILAGSPQESTGGDLRKQFVSNGTVQIDASRFLAGKTAPRAAIPQSPLAPASISVASTTVAGTATAFVAAQKYVYFATSENELGESIRATEQTATILVSGDVVDVTINHPASGTVRWFNVYRSLAGGTVAKAQYIGRVAITAGASSTVFRDLGNKAPGFVTGYLIQGDTMVLKELMPFRRKKLAETDFSSVEAFGRAVTLCVTTPRKMVLIDNLK